MLTRRERLLAVLRGESAGRISLLGGWALGDPLHQAIAGCSQEEYWRDPARHAIEAHRLLGVNGIMALRVPGIGTVAEVKQDKEGR